MVRNSSRPDPAIIRAAINDSRTIEEAAARLNVHRTTLWRWLRDLSREGQPIELRRTYAA